MAKWEAVSDVLDFAIRNEEEAATFYREIASRAKNAVTKQVFEDYATEEDGHKSKLLKVKSSGTLKKAAGTVLDLKVGDYLVESVTADMDYQQMLILAMKKEKAAFRLYTDMAGAANDEGLKEILLFLAQEEAKHKLRFEIEYDEQILREN